MLQAPLRLILAVTRRLKVRTLAERQTVRLAVRGESTVILVFNFEKKAPQKVKFIIIPLQQSGNHVIRQPGDPASSTTS